MSIPNSTIQWFPGHMNSARKKAEETLERADVVIEVLDARVPHASCNPMIEQLRKFRNRPALKLLNKTDLADPGRTKLWLDWFNDQPGVKAVGLSCKKPGDVARVPKLALELAPHRGTPDKPLRMMIMGIPNVGKSTLMNALLKRRVANVGDEPAVTKQQQRLDLNDRMMLTDTPGLMWPKIEHIDDGMKLAVCHAIGRNALIDEEVAAFLGDYLLSDYAKLLTARFGAPPDDCDGPALVEWLARKRGFLLKGGVLDLDKAANVLLHEFREGLIGRISLETPDQVAAMIERHKAAQAAALAAAAAQKDAGADAAE